MSRNKKITTILFDFDGTLADTMGILIKIINDSLKEVKVPINFHQLSKVNNELKSKIFNESFKQSRIIIIKFLFYYANKVGLNKKQTLKFIIICLRKLRQFYQTAKLYPDVSAVLEYLKKEGYILGIVTTASKKNIQQLLIPPYIQYFNCIITREMVKNLKPSPEGLYRALIKLQSTSNMSIYIGDLPQDIIAGHKAGMLVIALERDHISKETLELYKPDAICANLTEAVAWILQYNEK